MKFSSWLKESVKLVEEIVTELSKNEIINLLKTDVNKFNRLRIAKKITNVDLRGADLRGADLRRANLIEADLSEADLSGAKLFGASLQRAIMVNAIMVSADLSYATLYDADLSRADLSYANLSNANLGKNLIMSHANLSHANLRGVDLSEANLDGADLEGVKNYKFSKKPEVSKKSEKEEYPDDYLQKSIIEHLNEIEDAGDYPIITLYNLIEDIQIGYEISSPEMKNDTISILKKLAADNYIQIGKNYKSIGKNNADIKEILKELIEQGEIEKDEPIILILKHIS